MLVGIRQGQFQSPGSPNPGHAIRVLSELCAVRPDKPLGFNEVVVDFGALAASIATTPGIISLPRLTS